MSKPAFKFLPQKFAIIMSQFAFDFAFFTQIRGKTGPAAAPRQREGLPGLISHMPPARSSRSDVTMSKDHRIHAQFFGPLVQISE